MSFETTLNKAIEDFKAKFTSQHREAMKQEFETAQTMMLDAHKSLNEAEKVMGLELTVLPKLDTVIVGQAEAKAVELTADVQKLLAMRKVKKAHRDYEKSLSGGHVQVTRDRVKRDLYVAMTEGTAAGLTMTEINKACKRSASWAHVFISNFRKAQVI